MIPLGLYGAARPVASGGPVVLASDSFNRANGPLNGSTSDAAYGGTPGVWYNSASHEITSNRVTVSSGLLRWSSHPVAQTDVHVSVLLVALPNTNYYSLVAARAQTADLRTRNYATRVYPDGSLEVTVESGGLTALASAAAGTVNPGDVVGIKCVGTTISSTVNAVTVASATDATFASSTYAGFLTRNASVIIDDFKVEEAA